MGITGVSYKSAAQPQFQRYWIQSHVQDGEAHVYQCVGPTWWPVWGYNNDLYMGGAGPPGTGYAQCNQGTTYSGSPNQVCGGQYDWGETALEVWRLATVEPTRQQGVVTSLKRVCAINQFVVRRSGAAKERVEQVVCS